MTLPFYLDHHLDPDIADGLRRHGIDVVIPRDAGTNRLPDEQLLTLATNQERVFVSKDRDLPVIAARWLRESLHFAGLVYITDERISIGKAMEDLLLIAEAFSPEEMADHVEYIPY